MAKVDDVSSPSNSTLGFKNGSNTDDDYSYDANGNMTIDKNKGITTAIKYNHLNLPTEIIFAPATPVKKINYLYSATGEKLQKTVTNGTSITITDYLGGFQYIKVGTAAVVLQYFPHPEGYVNFDNGVYKHVFCYKDHLGNVRMSYTKDNTTGLPVIMEQNHYYPFGLKHTNYNTTVLKLRGSNVEPALTSVIKKRYNGKEWQDELGLNWYDYQARNYDPAIGRWFNIDVKSEMSRRFSPYAYALNNPVYFIDPDGMLATPSDGDDWINWTASNGQQHITYDTDVKTKEQAEAKGYGNVKEVFASGSAHSNDYNTMVDFAADGSFVVNNGEKMDVDDTSYTTENGTYISENKGVVDATGEFMPKALQDAGDSITLAAVPVAMTGVGLPAAEVMATVGGGMSTIGTGAEILNDLFEGEFSFTKTATKVLIETASRKLGGSNSFGPAEQIVNDNVFNGLDRAVDEVNKNKKIF